jgi:hypothetical protein
MRGGESNEGQEEKRGKTESKKGNEETLKK